jgi:hypothetical protein
LRTEEAKKLNPCRLLLLLLLLMMMMRKTENLIDSRKDVGLEVNAEKTRYMLMSHHQTARQNRDIKIVNRCFENVTQFRYLRTTVTNQNLIHEEIKSRLNSGNSCYHSIQNLLSSHLLSKNIKIRIYRTVVLPVVLYGCETWCLALRVEHRLVMFEKRVLRRTFILTRDEVTGGWRKFA